MIYNEPQFKRDVYMRLLDSFESEYLLIQERYLSSKITDVQKCMLIDIARSDRGLCESYFVEMVGYMFDPNED